MKKKPQKKQKQKPLKKRRKNPRAPILLEFLKSKLVHKVVYFPWHPNLITFTFPF